MIYSLRELGATSLDATWPGRVRKPFESVTLRYPSASRDTRPPTRLSSRDGMTATTNRIVGNCAYSADQSYSTTSQLFSLPFGVRTLLETTQITWRPSTSPARTDDPSRNWRVDGLWCATTQSRNRYRRARRQPYELPLAELDRA